MSPAGLPLRRSARWEVAVTDGAAIGAAWSFPCLVWLTRREVAVDGECGGHRSVHRPLHVQHAEVTPGRWGHSMAS